MYEGIKSRNVTINKREKKLPYLKVMSIYIYILCTWFQNKEWVINTCNDFFLIVKICSNSMEYGHSIYWINNVHVEFFILFFDLSLMKGLTLSSFYTLTFSPPMLNNSYWLIMITIFVKNIGIMTFFFKQKLKLFFLIIEQVITLIFYVRTLPTWSL